MQRSDISLKSSLLYAMLIFQLLKGDLHIFSKLALLILVDEENMLDSNSMMGYFCL